MWGLGAETRTTTVFLFLGLSFIWSDQKKSA